MLRILILGSTRGRQDTSSGSMARALAARHEVFVFEYERGTAPFQGRLRHLNSLYHLALKAVRQPDTIVSDRHLLAWARGRRFDVVFVLSIDLVPVGVVQQLRALTGGMVVGWFPDHIVNVGRAQFVAAPYERIFFKDKIIVSRFRQALASDRFEFLPQAFDPALHRPVPPSLRPTSAEVDVATYGNSYAYRAALLGPLLERHSLRFAIYGAPSWEIDRALRSVYRPPICGLEKSAAMRAAAVALNTNHFAELGGVNKRTFELAGMGAFQLTDGPAIADYLTPGIDCVTFSGPDDLVAKVEHYLSRPEERQAIAQAGLLKAWRQHTFQHRFNEMFDNIAALRSVPPLPTPIAPPAPMEGLPRNPAGDVQATEHPTTW